MILNQRRKRAFTLVEVAISIGIIALLTALGYAVMTAMNQNAVKARLMTLACASARDKIAQIQFASPYTPNLGTTYSHIPTILVVGTTTDNIPLYADPGTGKTVIPGTRQTVISDTGTNHILSAVVTVSYTYHGKAFQVQLNTLRASD